MPKRDRPGRAACRGRGAQRTARDQQADDDRGDHDRGHPSRAGMVPGLGAGPALADRASRTRATAIAATHQNSAAAEALAQDQPGQHEQQRDAGGQHRLHHADRLERQHDDLAGQPGEHQAEPGQPGRIGQQAGDDVSHPAHVQRRHPAERALLQDQPDVVGGRGQQRQPGFRRRARGSCALPPSGRVRPGGTGPRRTSRRNRPPRRRRAARAGSGSTAAAGPRW